MHVFMIIPSRAYGLDVVVPLLFELRERFPRLKATFIAYHKKELVELRNNIVLYNHVRELGSVVKIYGFPYLERRAKRVNRIFKFIAMIPILLWMLFSRRSIVFYPRRIETLIDRIIVKLNGVSGKTFCYLMATTSLQENLAQYFDKNGNRLPGVRLRPERINVANGLLAYHEDNAKYLELQGYKNNLFIGYPMMYPTFQKHIRDSRKNYLDKEIGADNKNHSIVTIFLNKYYGKTSGRDDQWVKERLSEAVTITRQIIPNSYILVRPHPMVPSEKVVSMINNLQVSNVKQTHLHIYILACSSLFVVSIAQSSSGFHALAFGAPVIDYGRIGEQFYKQFPSGSLYSDFGVEVAYTPDELALKINQVLNDDRASKMFEARLNHHMDLDIFDRYWAQYGQEKKTTKVVEQMTTPSQNYLQLPQNRHKLVPPYGE